jgi:protein transport protein SEC20
VHSIEQADRRDPRERLFPAGYVPPAKRRHHRRNRTGDSSNAHDGDGNIIGAASDVTTALRRTHDLMAAEMSKSTFAHETLAQSTAALQQLSESYGSLDSLLAGSRDLLGTLLKSQKSDTWYLETALALLLGTLGWLIFRRWLYGPLWWLVYFPLRTGFGVTFWAGKSAVGVARSGGGGAGASMEVVGAQGEGTKVVDMSGGAVPTVGVGQAKTEEEIEHDPDSMVGKVGRIIDGETPDGESGTSSSEGGGQSRENEPRNPKKRMWEEDKEAAKQEQRAKDEL